MPRATATRGNDPRPDTYPDGTPRPHVDWDKILEANRDTPRRLTAHELRRLRDLGFPEVAARFAAGTCPGCGLNRAGRGHRELCQEPMRPLTPRPAPPQPWHPRPARRAA